MAGPMPSPPFAAQVARAFVLLGVWPGLMVLPGIPDLVLFGGDVDWVAILVMVLALGFSALAIASCVGLGSR